MKFLHGTLRSGSFSKNRIDAFSDGVFSIVITLLVIEIRVPHLSEHSSHALLVALKEMLPKFLCYMLSFAYIAIYWVNHHQLFHILKRADRGLFWVNNLFLMFLAFIPFPTALIGEYSNLSTAVIFYGVAMFAAALSFVVLKWYTVYAKLVDPAIEANVLKESLFKLVIGLLLYFAAIIAAFFNTYISIAIYIVIPIIYFFPGELEKKGL